MLLFQPLFKRSNGIRPTVNRKPNTTMGPDNFLRFCYYAFISSVQSRYVGYVENLLLQLYLFSCFHHFAIGRASPWDMRYIVCIVYAHFNSAPMEKPRIMYSIPSPEIWREIQRAGTRSRKRERKGEWSERNGKKARLSITLRIFISWKLDGSLFDWIVWVMNVGLPLTIIEFCPWNTEDKRLSVN